MSTSEMQRASLVLAFLLALTGTLAGGTSAVVSSPDSTARLSALEQSVLIRLNTIRASKGLRPLVFTNGLKEAALAHSQSMLDAGFFKHESRDGSPFFVRVKRYYGAAGFQQWSVGENLFSSTGTVGAAGVIKAWLDSPSHRNNMLSPTWREVGIGALRAGSAGGTFDGEPTVVITMDFGTRSGTGSRTLRVVKPVTRVLPAPSASNPGESATSEAAGIQNG